jgi:hypothetical protein
MPGPAVNRSINAATARKRGVRRVDNCVNVQRRDVSLYDVDHWRLPAWR